MFHVPTTAIKLGNSDMSMQQDTFTSTIEHFAAEEEEIRAAAAFAAG